MVLPFVLCYSEVLFVILEGSRGCILQYQFRIVNPISKYEGMLEIHLYGPSYKIPNKLLIDHDQVGLYRCNISR